MSERKGKGTRMVLGSRALRACLVFTIFWAWEATLVYVPLLHHPEANASLFWTISNYGCVVVCAMAILFSGATRRFMSSRFFLPVIVALLEAGTLVAVLPAMTGGANPMPVSILGGCCWAAGIILMDLELAFLLVEIPAPFPRRATVMIGMVFHLLLYLLIDNLPIQAVLLCSLAMPALAGAIAKGGGKPTAGQSVEPGSGHAAAADGLLENLRGLKERVHVPIGLLAAFFIVSLSINFLRNAAIDRLGIADAFSGSAYISITVLLIVAASAVELAFAMKRRRTAIPFAAIAYSTAAIVMVFVFPESDTLILPLIFAGFFLYVTVFYRTAADSAFEHAEHFVPTVVAVFLANSLGLSAGALTEGALRTFVGFDYSPVFMGLAYLLFVAGSQLVLHGRLSFLPNAKKNGESEGRKGALRSASLSELLDLSCDLLSQEYGLTSRESDTLRLLVRGRKLQSIADEMSVSANTAKSHTRHVYQKLGVHSSEELFDLVEHPGGDR